MIFVLGFALPSHWISAETGRPYERVEVARGSPEFNAVIDNMKTRDGEIYVQLVYKV